LLAGNTSSLALKGSCLPPPLLGCTRPRNTVGHRIASLPTSHLLLCTDSDRVSDSPPGTTVHAANFFLTDVYLPVQRGACQPRVSPHCAGLFVSIILGRERATRRPGAASDGGRRPYRETPIKGRRWNPPELARQGDTHTAGVGDAAISLGETPPTPKLGRRAPRLPKRT
jgi:hypothetical protein